MLQKLFILMVSVMAFQIYLQDRQMAPEFYSDERIFRQKVGENVKGEALYLLTVPDDSQRELIGRLVKARG
jgi:hypothetical protein